MSALTSAVQSGSNRAFATYAATAGARSLSSPPGTANPLSPNARARQQAVDFESMFLSSMFSQMFTGIDGDGPFGGGGSAGVWRSFLTDEYSKSFARAGGIGIADHVYRSLLTQQEARTPTNLNASTGPSTGQ